MMEAYLVVWGSNPDWLRLIFYLATIQTCLAALPAPKERYQAISEMYPTTWFPMRQMGNTYHTVFGHRWQFYSTFVKAHNTGRTNRAREKRIIDFVIRNKVHLIVVCAFCKMSREIWVNLKATRHTYNTIDGDHHTYRSSLNPNGSYEFCRLLLGSPATASSLNCTIFRTNWDLWVPVRSSLSSTMSLVRPCPWLSFVCLQFYSLILLQRIQNHLLVA